MFSPSLAQAVYKPVLVFFVKKGKKKRSTTWKNGLYPQTAAAQTAVIILQDTVILLPWAQAPTTLKPRSSMQHSIHDRLTLDRRLRTHLCTMFQRVDTHSELLEQVLNSPQDALSYLNASKLLFKMLGYCHRRLVRQLGSAMSISLQDLVPDISTYGAISQYDIDTTNRVCFSSSVPKNLHSSVQPGTVSLKRCFSSQRQGGLQLEVRGFGVHSLVVDDAALKQLVQSGN